MTGVQYFSTSHVHENLVPVVAQVVGTMAGTNPLSPLPGKALVETGSFLGTSTSIFPMSVDEEM